MSIIGSGSGTGEEVVVHRCAAVKPFDIETDQGEVVRLRFAGSVGLGGASTTAEVDAGDGGAGVAWLLHDFARRTGQVAVGRMRVRRCVVRAGDRVTVVTTPDESSSAPTRRPAPLFVTAIRKGSHSRPGSAGALRWDELAGGLGLLRSSTTLARSWMTDLQNGSPRSAMYAVLVMVLCLVIEAEEGGIGSPGAIGAASILAFAFLLARIPAHRFLRTDSWFTRSHSLVLAARNLRRAVYATGLACLLAPIIAAAVALTSGLGRFAAVWSAVYALSGCLTLRGAVGVTIDRERRRFEARPAPVVARKGDRSVSG